MSVERLHTIQEAYCPVCKERASYLSAIHYEMMIRRYEIGYRVYYIHLKCIDSIVKEWLGKYGPKQD